MADRIYLDNAATSWPKPEAVYAAVDAYLRSNGATAGRGVYHEAMEVDRLLTRARTGVARLLDVASADHVVFTLNATDALNLALHGIVRPGDRVVTSELEHNSILRPLKFLEQSRGVQVVRVPCDELGQLDLSALEASLREPTRLVAITAASNVSGALVPLPEVVSLAKRAGALVLIDAAQIAGVQPLDMQRLGIDLVATSGHKGLLGPLGTGLLAIAPGLENELEPLRQGGTGSRSDEDVQPLLMPDRYESGNLNVPGIAGLAAGVEYLLSESIPSIGEREQRLTQTLLAELHATPGVKVLGPPPGVARASLVAFTLEGYDPREAASLLDASFQIQVRAGLHCAPLVHRRLGAWPTGSIRMSLGPFTTDEQIDAAVQAVRAMVAG
jgi:cysteine desulfurase family protein